MKKTIYLFLSCFVTAKKWLCIGGVFSFGLCSAHQNNGLAELSSKTDSLQKLLIATDQDTARAAIYVAISEELYSSNIDTVLPLCLKAIQIIDSKLNKANELEKRSFLTSKANALNNIGYVHLQHGNIPKAVEWFWKSAIIYKEIGNKPGFSILLNNIAVIYHKQGDISKALDWYHESLKIQEEIGDKQGVARSLSNIGSIYNTLDDIPRALEWYRKSLKIYETIGDIKGVATLYNNIAFIYNNKGNSQEALEYFQKSLKIENELGNKDGIARTLNNMGSSYYKKGNIPDALEAFRKSLKIYEEIGDKSGIASSLDKIGVIYLEQKKYAEAEIFCALSLKIAKELGFPESIYNASLTLSKIYKIQGGAAETSGNMAVAADRYKNAMEMKDLFKLMADSISNAETRKSVLKKQMQYEFEKKESEANAEQNKKDAVAKEEKQRQIVIRNSFIGGFVLVLTLALMISKGYRQKQKANKELADKNLLIEEQKEVVEQKNKNITDSINYAKLIQEAIFSSKELKYKLFPDAFVLYQPKDIVSGDFYWFTGKNNKRLIATVDCTGHGVPGAFMSMIGNAFLNEIINEKGITTPSEILKQLRDNIIFSLKQKEGENSDGMDISILCFDEKGSTVEFAGANNPLWLIRNGIIEEIKGDKQPIGLYHGESKPFTNHKIELQKNDSLYIFTDGYADQFGGKTGKKFKYKQLQEVLLSIQDKPMLEQEKILIQKINVWKESLEQVDDILIIGVRV